MRDDDGTGRWADLFADLSAELDAAEQAELDAEVRERSRAETGRLRLVDRLRGALGHPLTVDTIGAGRLAGRLSSAGPDWLLLTDGNRDVVVPLAAVTSVGGLVATSASPGGERAVDARLDLRYALREIARRRQAVSVCLVDGRTVHGTVDRVGADFIEVAAHPVGEPRRARDVRAVQSVPLAAVAAVRST